MMCYQACLKDAILHEMNPVSKSDCIFERVTFHIAFCCSALASFKALKSVHLLNTMNLNF